MSNDWNIPEHRLENYNYIHWKEKKPSVEILDSFDNILVNETKEICHYIRISLKTISSKVSNNPLSVQKCRGMLVPLESRGETRERERKKKSRRRRWINEDTARRRRVDVGSGNEGI